jgi:hypothetical protein
MPKRRNPLQASMFVEDSPIAELIGQRVELKRSRDTDCRRCKTRIGLITGGTGQHRAAIHCSSCGVFREWMPSKMVDALLDAVKTFGKLEPIVIRDPTVSVGKDGVVIFNNAREKGTENDMTTFDDMYGSKWLSADDLGDEAPRYKIKEAEIVSLRDKDGRTNNKLVLRFNNVEKGLILNKTNAGRMATAYGKDESRWIGKVVELYTETTTYGLGVRIRILKDKTTDPISTGKINIIPDPELNDEIQYN